MEVTEWDEVYSIAEQNLEEINQLRLLENYNPEKIKQLELDLHIDVHHLNKLSTAERLESLNKWSEELGTGLDSLRVKILKKKAKVNDKSDVRLYENEKAELGIKLWSFMAKKEELQSDFASVVEEFDRLESRFRSFYRDNIITEEKSELFEFLEDETISLQNGIESLNKEATKLRNVYDSLDNVLESDIESLNNEKSKLRADTELLNKEKSTVESDFCSLNEKKTILESEIQSLSNVKTKLRADTELLNRGKSTVESDICSLNEKKTILESEIESLSNVKTKLRADTEFVNKEKTELQSDVEFLNQEKTKLGMDVVLLNKRKSELETDSQFIQNRMLSDIESWNKEKGKLENDFEVTNKARDKLRNDVELLNEEKDKLQSDIEFLNEEKAEFVRSVTSEVNDSFYEREKTLAENEEVVASERSYIQELREAQQELIKQMASEKVTKNTVIGVKKRKRGDQVLWNFKDNKRATLKEVINIHLKRTKS